MTMIRQRRHYARTFVLPGAKIKVPIIHINHNQLLNTRLQIIQVSRKEMQTGKKTRITMLG